MSLIRTGVAVIALVLLITLAGDHAAAARASTVGPDRGPAGPCVVRELEGDVGADLSLGVGVNKGPFSLGGALDTGADLTITAQRLADLSSNVVIVFDQSDGPEINVGLSHQIAGETEEKASGESPESTPDPDATEGGGSASGSSTGTSRSGTGSGTNGGEGSGSTQEHTTTSSTQQDTNTSSTQENTDTTSTQEDTNTSSTQEETTTSSTQEGTGGESTGKSTVSLLPTLTEPSLSLSVAFDNDEAAGNSWSFPTIQAAQNFLNTAATWYSSHTYVFLPVVGALESPSGSLPNPDESWLDLSSSADISGDATEGLSFSADTQVPLGELTGDHIVYNSAHEPIKVLEDFDIPQTDDWTDNPLLTPPGITGTLELTEPLSSTGIPQPPTAADFSYETTEAADALSTSVGWSQGLTGEVEKNHKSYETDLALKTSGASTAEEDETRVDMSLPITNTADEALIAEFLAGGNNLPSAERSLYEELKTKGAIEITGYAVDLNSAEPFGIDGGYDFINGSADVSVSGETDTLESATFWDAKTDKFEPWLNCSQSKGAAPLHLPPGGRSAQQVWQDIPTDGLPKQLGATKMAYDTSDDQLMLTNLVNGPGSGTFTLTDGEVWKPASGGAAYAPGHSRGAYLSDPIEALADDPDLGGVVALVDGTTTLQTWLWNGHDWHFLGDKGPPARVGTSAIFDPSLGGVALFGGRTPAGYLNDLWLLKGSSWSELSPSTPPGARAYNAIYYDTATQQLFVYGGNSASGSTDSAAPEATELWSLNPDGTAWTLDANFIGTSPGFAAPQTYPIVAVSDTLGEPVLFGRANGYMLAQGFTQLLEYVWQEGDYWQGVTDNGIGGVPPNLSSVYAGTYDPTSNFVFLLGQSQTTAKPTVVQALIEQPDAYADNPP